MIERDWSQPLALEIIGERPQTVFLEKAEEADRKLAELQAFPCTSVDVEAPHTLTQQQQIIWTLRRYGKISLWDTVYKNWPNNRINCMRLGARIWELKELGIEFEGEWKNNVFKHPLVELPNGKLVAEYRLKYWDGCYGPLTTRRFLTCPTA